MIYSVCTSIAVFGSLVAAGPIGAQCEVDILKQPELFGFGAHFAIDGQRVAVGSTLDFFVQGPTYIYEFDSDGAKVVQLLEPPEGHSDQLAGEIAAGGGSFFVNDSQAVPQGSAHPFGAIFVYSGDPLELVQTLWSPSDAWLTGFGEATVIDGETLFVGAEKGLNPANGQPSGKAYVYVKNESDWILQDTITNPEGQEGDLYGKSVALSGDVAIVGAPHDDDLGQDIGAAFIYRRKGDQWEREAILHPDVMPSEEMSFGNAVALDGDGETAVIGALEDNFGDGSAYVFEREDGKWGFTQKLIGSGLSGLLPWFGGSVILTESGETLFIGASGDDFAGFESGAVYKYSRENGEYVEVDTFVGSEVEGNDSFGGFMDLDGDRLMISALGADQAYIFAGILGQDCNENGVTDACEVIDGSAPDADGDFIPDPCECPPDTNGDRLINAADLNTILGAFGNADPPEPADLNDDGAVDTTDLNMVLGSFGEECR